MRITTNVGAKVLGAVLAVMSLLVFSFGTEAQTLAPVAGFWNGSTQPAFRTGDDSQSVELGMKFKSSVAGSITAIRFYKATNSRGTHTGTIWTSTGTKLASVTFTRETASGWQTQPLAAPLAISAGTTYVVSYHTVQYAWSSPFFTQAQTVAPLTAPANAGVYAYGNTVRFPTNTWKASNYWVDVVFSSTGSTAPVAPSITSQPVSRTVTAGQTASFSVMAAGSTLSYQWMRNGAAISGATSSNYNMTATTSDNGAQFAVTVSNSAGSVTSNSVTLTVSAAMVAPSITSQPVSRTVTAGQTASFSITAGGSSTLSYQWKKNNAAISGATSSSFNTAATTMSDNNAQFSCTVSNTAGSLTSNSATLTISAAAVAPSITSQPVSRTVLAGQSASFSVSVSGTAPFTYQWMKNGAAISGATSSSYNMTAATSDNNAQFAVTVSNATGNVTSNNASLTITAGTLLLSANPNSLSFGNIDLNSTVTKQVTLTNAGNSNLTLSGLSLAGAGFSGNGVSNGQILTPGQTATMNISFKPVSAGAVTGQVTVTSSAAAVIVTLSGSGVQQVSHSVSMNWTRSTSTVNGYLVYSSQISGGPYTKLTASSVNLPSYTDSSVQNGKTYYYVVTAVDATGVESTYSNQAAAVIQ